MASLIPPPDDPIKDGSPELDATIDDLRKRISELEAKSELQSLTAEADYKKLLVNEIKQRIRMRYASFVAAGIVLAFMAVFAWCSVDRYFLGHFVFIPPSLAIALIVAPVACISAVTIAILFGAFRRFKDDDLDKVNVTSIATEALKSTVGN